MSEPLAALLALVALGVLLFAAYCIGAWSDGPEEP
jgi:hypothetical protein